MKPRPTLSERAPATIALILGAIMSAVFAALLFRYDHELRETIREKMIQRDAAVLTGVAQQEIETRSSQPGGTDPERWLPALLPAAHRQGVLAMAIFDADGLLLEKIPTQQLLLDLPSDDFARLQTGRPVTRYLAGFALGALILGAPDEPTPVLEIVVPLRGRGASDSTPPNELIGFVRYHLDARDLAAELVGLEAGVRRQTVTTLIVGLTALGLIVAAAYVLLARAQRTILERTKKLQRANLELTLAAKTSALGQLTSHLIHGLQGSVAGLRTIMAQGASASPEWSAAAGYADRMQVMIEEIVGLLGDQAAETDYELTGRELADIIRRRNAPLADNKGVDLKVHEGFPENFDHHRGGLLCLIASNLVQNAIEACAPTNRVMVTLRRDHDQIALVVADTGPGIPANVREHLFEPGFTGRADGTGLGLAISQLLARQIGATLVLEQTGPGGTVFRVTVPTEPGGSR